jgi:AcrR family transcriptional regulator
VVAPQRLRTAHADSRLPQILDAAALLFCVQAYQGTTIRDIAQAVGILPGSLYCHFATKEDLLAAVYTRGVDQICLAVQAAVEPPQRPLGLGWKRPAWRTWRPSCVTTTTRASWCVCARPMSRVANQCAWCSERDRYEAMWADLADALPLPRRSDRKALRLMLLGALNWAQNWYRPDGPSSPRSIARQFTALLRQGTETPA